MSVRRLARPRGVCVRTDGSGAPAELQGGGTFIEGAISYLAVKRLSDGRVVLRRRYEGLIRLDRALAPGRYRVSSYVRSCSGTCDRLDPPTNRCATSVRVRSRSTVRLTVVSRDDRACRFERP